MVKAKYCKRRLCSVSFTARTVVSIKNSWTGPV